MVSLPFRLRTRISAIEMNKTYDAIIIGAGAAGLMCAIMAGQRGKRVLLLERNKRPGAKILISGGGRCNFTNLDVRPEAYLSENPHFAKSALSRYTPWDFMDLIAAHGLTWHEKTLGQLFCDQGSKAILKALMDEAQQVGVELRCGTDPRDILHEAGAYQVSGNGWSATAPALVVAAGGLSIPKMGATDFGYRIAKQFGLDLVPPKPALVPFVFDGETVAGMKRLAGVSVDSIVALAGGQRAPQFRENILFTHRGLSGPAILQISSYWQQGDSISIDMLPSDGDTGAWLRQQRTDSAAVAPKTVLGTRLPTRLAEQISEDLPAKIAELSNKRLQDIEARVRRWTLAPTGTEGFAKAEVTAGGVSTADLSSKTMEARGVQGLYFIGECVDVTGWLGGYNFQWAWASGHAAGLAL